MEEPEFTRPFPELFTSDEDALKNAEKYAKDLMDSRGFKAEDRDFIAKCAMGELKGNGEARVDLDDGTAVHWVLYHFGMEMENTDAGKRFCRKCGHELSTENVSPGYKFYCPNCDEDMYGIEARRR